MTTIRVPAIERSIPTPIPYMVERVQSDVYEVDTHTLSPDGRPALEVVAAWRAAREAEQRQQIDARDDAVRECHGMPARKYGYNKAAPAPGVYVGPQAQALKTNDAGLPAELRHDLRKAALRLGELTREPVDLPVPSSEAAAVATLKQLRAAIFDVERGAKA